MRSMVHSISDALVLVPATIKYSSPPSIFASIITYIAGSTMLMEPSANTQSFSSFVGEEPSIEPPPSQTTATSSLLSATRNQAISATGAYEAISTHQLRRSKSTSHFSVSSEGSNTEDTIGVA